MLARWDLLKYITTIRTDEKKQVVKLGLAFISTMKLCIMASFYCWFIEKSSWLTREFLRILTVYIKKHQYN